jgi:hypothetical protein
LLGIFRKLKAALNDKSLGIHHRGWANEAKEIPTAQIIRNSICPAMELSSYTVRNQKSFPEEE